MSVKEFLLRMLVSVEPLLPAVVAVVVVSLLAVAALALCTRGLWVNQKRIRWLGLFFDLGHADCVCLACGWLKFLFLLAFLIFFQKLSILGYIFFAAPGLICALHPGSAKRIPSRLVWLVLELAALLFTNLVCGFYRDVGGGVGFLVIYICMALFTALLGFYIFLMEINDISVGRKAKAND